MNKVQWTTWGVVSFVIFCFYEAYAMFDGNEDTYTLTTTVITYVPQWIFWTVVGPFLLWFTHHFYTYYRRYYKEKYKNKTFK